MSVDKFIADFKAYFTSFEMTDYDVKRLSEMFNKYQRVVYVEKEKIRRIKEVVINHVPEFKLIYVDSETKQPVTVPKDVKKLNVICDSVIYEVCNIWGVTKEELVSRTRKRELVYARCFCYMKLRTIGFTLSEIARRFNRDHTTVMYGIETSKNMLETNCEPFTFLWNKYNEKDGVLEMSPAKTA